MFQYAALRAFGLRHNIPIFYPSKFPPAPDLHAFFNILQSDFIDGEYDSHVEPYFQYKDITNRRNTLRMLRKRLEKSSPFDTLRLPRM